MTQKLEVYKCNVCGNIVEVLHAGKGELVCCGQPMEKQIGKSEDEGQEKHLPVIEEGEGTVVKVGSTSHPMDEDHYIEWIAVNANGKVLRKFLQPGDDPKAEFNIKSITSARAYCNVHGLWKVIIK